MSSGRLRIAWLDFARALAIISVVMCHSVESIYTLSPASLATLSTRTNIFAVTAFTFGRIGVPLFLFISGYLLLDRPWDNQACKRFWKTHWLPLFACIEAWIVIYFFFLNYIAKRPAQPNDLVLEMLFLKKVEMGHYWYMPMIIGFYLFLPVMGAALSRLEPRTVAFPLAAASLCCFVIPIVKPVMALAGMSVKLDPQINVGFAGGVYGIYLILGWCVKKQEFKRIPTVALACGGIALFVGCVALQHVCHARGVQYNVWYDNGALMLCGLMAFILMSKMPPQWFTNSKPEPHQGDMATPPTAKPSFPRLLCPLVLFLRTISHALPSPNAIESLHQATVPFHALADNRSVSIQLAYLPCGMLAHCQAPCHREKVALPEVTTAGLSSSGVDPAPWWKGILFSNGRLSSFPFDLLVKGVVPHRVGAA